MDELKNQEFTNFKGAKKVVSRVRLILEEKKDIPLEIEKGKRYWWKFFGIIPLVKYTAKKNLYRPYKDFCCRTFEGMVYTDFFNNSRVYKFDYDKEEIFKCTIPFVLLAVGEIFILFIKELRQLINSGIIRYK